MPGVITLCALQHTYFSKSRCHQMAYQLCMHSIILCLHWQATEVSSRLEAHQEGGFLMFSPAAKSVMSLQVYSCSHRSGSREEMKSPLPAPQSIGTVIPLLSRIYTSNSTVSLSQPYRQCTGTTHTLMLAPFASLFAQPAFIYYGNLLFSLPCSQLGTLSWRKERVFSYVA